MFSNHFLHTSQKLSIFVGVLALSIPVLSVSVPAHSKDSGIVSVKTVDKCIEDRAALLALDQQAFDQDLKGGWRAISDKKGCEAAAADLIRDYRNNMDDSINSYLLFWHEGQVRAEIGQTETAIKLFKQSYKKDDAAWDLYADATIAFLEHNHEALLASRAELVALPKPKDWVDSAEVFGGKYIMQHHWPKNLNVVDGFLKCFEKPYDEAYNNCAASFRLKKNPLYHGD